MERPQSESAQMERPQTGRAQMGRARKGGAMTGAGPPSLPRGTAPPGVSGGEVVPREGGDGEAGEHAGGAFRAALQPDDALLVTGGAASVL